AANLPTQPKTPGSATAATNTITGKGGLNPSDFASNPLIAGTPAPPYTNAVYTGTVVNNDNTTPTQITGATQLVGTAGSSS
ncbi:hypothetical protein ABTN53_19685, partial [Acinetobacter baumannii]